MATGKFVEPKAMDEYLNDFYVKLPINGYGATLARKVTLLPKFLSKEDNKKINVIFAAIS